MKTIQELWAQFDRAAVPASMPASVRKELEHAFHAGILALLATLAEIGRTSQLGSTDEERQAMMKRLFDEGEAWIEQARANGDTGSEACAARLEDILRNGAEFEIEEADWGDTFDKSIPAAKLAEKIGPITAAMKKLLDEVAGADVKFCSVFFAEGAAIVGAHSGGTPMLNLVEGAVNILSDSAEKMALEELQQSTELMH